jgi:hypothetical protein
MMSPILLRCLVGSALALVPRADGDRAVVVAEVLDVFDEPAAEAYSTGQLHEGNIVEVHTIEPDGWVAIRPPAGSFEWIDATALEERGADAALIRAPRATLRSGRPGARMPGPPIAALERGTVVRLMDREPLRLRQGRSTRTWRAIEPPEGLLRYVRGDGLQLGTRPKPAPSRQSAKARPLRVDPGLVSIGPAIDAARLSAGQAQALQRLEADHRRILRGPIASWRLERVLDGYRSIAERVADPAAREGLRRRLDRAGRQASAADAARRFAAVLAEGHHRAAAPSSADSPATDAPDDEPPFDAQGLLQPSSKLVEGERVYALIGPEGRAVAYLRPAPGIMIRPLLGRQVGARGTARYDANLRAEVIRVRTLEALRDAP